MTFSMKLSLAESVPLMGSDPPVTVVGPVELLVPSKVSTPLLLFVIAKVAPLPASVSAH